ncbi:hypothetical protein M427DRAFT_40877 [Gonapodya prolifera JEL478]|uniref:SH3 domain-containing protein n=1 Tax=Gonapodya prolifera (strain JEL478) TaxID=1344416 RepID=A0A139AX59_GONPJ|nr:hypothetical protein M427DRAFT_40877 [Gonapodya prolifera JEL478]|eukprot:KXS21289.1 hypothetical protein M427DRAFT_40877 [Gonapodya prolifera JEL478]
MPHTTRPLPLLAATLFLLLALSHHASAQNQAADCAVFENLYAQVNKDLPWPKGNCCGWAISDRQAVTCTSNATDGRIVEAFFTNVSFPGATIPPLASLDRVQQLSLDDNMLTGQIPPLASLIRLRQLWLDHNNLTGPIPDMSGINNLATIVLYYNNLTGNVDNVFPQSVSTCTITFDETNPGLYTCNNSYPDNCNAVARFAQYFTKQTKDVCDAAAAAASASASSASAASATPPSPAAASSPTGTPQSLNPGSASSAAAEGPGATNSVTPSQATATSGGKGSGILIPVIAAVGTVLVIGIAVGAFIFVRRSRRKNAEVPSSPAHPGPGPDMARAGAGAGAGAGRQYQYNGPGSMSLATDPDTVMRKDSTPPSRRTTTSAGTSSRTVGGSQQLSTAGGEDDLLSESPHWTFMYFAGVANKNARQIDIPSGSPVLWVEEEFTPRNGDEVAVSVGDQFKLRAVFRDGWGYGRNVETEQAGLLPLDHLRLGSEPQPPPSAYPYGRFESVRFPSKAYAPPGSGSSGSTAYDSNGSSNLNVHSRRGSGAVGGFGGMAPSEAAPLIPSGVSPMDGYSQRMRSRVWFRGVGPVPVPSAQCEWIPAVAVWCIRAVAVEWLPPVDVDEGRAQAVRPSRVRAVG